ncbi:crAss001_48 related protein [Methylomonas sp. MgM2]
MELQPHQQRVVTEKDELDEKLNKLRAFFDTDIYANLDEAERSRLSRQSRYMEYYSDVLGERISAFAC